jgi:hypothetical protein
LSLLYGVPWKHTFARRKLDMGEDEIGDRRNRGQSVGKLFHFSGRFERSGYGGQELIFFNFQGYAVSIFHLLSPDH